jgi:hypothetical protein
MRMTEKNYQKNLCEQKMKTGGITTKRISL